MTQERDLAINAVLMWTFLLAGLFFGAVAGFYLGSYVLGLDGGWRLGLRIIVALIAGACFLAGAFAWMERAAVIRNSSAPKPVISDAILTEKITLARTTLHAWEVDGELPGVMRRAAASLRQQLQ